MGFHFKRRHMIDFIFPLALFLVFTLSALTLILLAAGIYQSSTESSAQQYTARTALAYISEKIHQNDESGSIYLGNIDECDALIIDQIYDAEIYHTYIYAYGYTYGNEQSLKELFIKDGAEASAADGRTILEIRDFSMEQLSDNLFQFECTDTKNNTISTIIGIRSK